VPPPDRDIPLYRVGSMDELVSEAAAQPRFQTVLLTAFAVLALLAAPAVRTANLDPVQTLRDQ
jgi:hypothetical protein